MTPTGAQAEMERKDTEDWSNECVLYGALGMLGGLAMSALGGTGRVGAQGMFLIYIGVPVFSVGLSGKLLRVLIHPREHPFFLGLVGFALLLVTVGQVNRALSRRTAAKLIEAHPSSTLSTLDSPTIKMIYRAVVSDANLQGPVVDRWLAAADTVLASRSGAPR